MNLRCMYCQTLFGVSREVMLIGLQTMEAEKLSYYEVYCPKCRRANRVERKKLELANPNWQETLKTMAKEATKAEKEQAAVEAAKPAPKPKVAPKAKAAPSKAKTESASKVAPKKSTAKPAAESKTTAAKTPAKKTANKAKGK
jgi:phage FluMu protein Com